MTLLAKSKKKRNSLKIHKAKLKSRDTFQSESSLENYSNNSVLRRVTDYESILSRNKFEIKTSCYLAKTKNVCFH